MFSPTAKAAQNKHSAIKQMKQTQGAFNSAQKTMKSPNALVRTDSQQENGLIMGSLGGNTPTPHKFGAVGANMISEFDPMSGQKGEYRNTLKDNYVQSAVGATNQIDMQPTRSLKTFASPKASVQKSASKF